MTTDELIFNTAKADGMPETLAVLMVAQARLESGNYQHKFFTSGKNAFGYMYDKNSRYQISPGSLADNKHPIARYSTVQDSVHEVTAWIKRRQKDGQFPKDLKIIKTPLQYTKYLREGRHPYGGRSTSEYSQGIISRLSQLPQKLLDILNNIPGKAAIGAGAVILLLAGVFF